MIGTKVNFLLLYGAGCLMFAAAMICIWGFIYRPHARFANGRGTWTNDEIIRFALTQSLVWPFALIANLVSLSFWLVCSGLFIGRDWIVERLADKLPSGDERHPGFRRRLNPPDKYGYRDGHR